MKVFVSKHTGSRTLLLHGRAEDALGNVGDFGIDLNPGSSAFGIPYNEWFKLDWAILDSALPGKFKDYQLARAGK